MNQDTNQDTVITASLNPEVNLKVEVEEAPMPFQDAIDDANAVVKWPGWVRKGYVTAVRNLKCFEIVRRHVLDGLPSTEVGRLIQSLGEMPDDYEFAVRCVDHYRATVPKAEKLANRYPIKHIEKKLKKAIDVRDDLEKLKNWMFERLEIAVTREKSFGMLLPNTEKSFSVALEIVSKIQEIQEKEIGNPEQVRQQAQSWTKTDFDQLYGKPGINDTLKNPVSRMKIARFLDQTMQLVGGMDEQKRERLLEEAKKKMEQQVEVLPPDTSDR